MQSQLPALLLALGLAACVAKPPPAPAPTPRPTGADLQLPPYVRYNFEPFTRITATAIALREWRAFGMPVNDEPPPPDNAPGLPRSLRSDRQAGLWQRVADYWWFGQDFGTPEADWSSLFNQNGTPYSGDAPAWSAAFISYVMRAAGAGAGFPYTPLHADYINAAARGEGVLSAQPPAAYAPQPGDLICYGRRGAQAMQFADLPTGRFFGHCDIVVQATPGQVAVIGGNVSGAVTMKHVPTTGEGMLATPDNILLDSRYPWFVVLKVQYAL